MLSRPSRGSFLRTLWIAAAAAILGAPVACTVGFTTSDSSGGTAAGPFNEFDAGMSGDDGGDSAATTDAGARVYQGSPLCNFSNASSRCNPDLPTTLQSCKGTQYAPDGGAPASDAGEPSGTLRCFVDISTVNGMTSYQQCEAPGQGTDGQACQSGADCAAGFECIGSGVCRHYCCDPHECEKLGATTFCDVQTMTGGSHADTRVPVCMPVQPCKLLLPGYCETGTTCAPVRSDGTTSCVAIGPAKVGDNCDRDHCDKDLACLGAPGSRTCYQLCHTDSTTECPPNKRCRTSSAQFSDPNIGVCQ